MKATIADHDHVYGAIEDTDHGIVLSGDKDYLQRIVDINRTRYVRGLWRSLTDAEFVQSLPERLGVSYQVALG